METGPQFNVSSKRPEKRTLMSLESEESAFQDQLEIVVWSSNYAGDKSHLINEIMVFFHARLFPYSLFGWSSFV